MHLLSDAAEGHVLERIRPTIGFFIVSSVVFPSMFASVVCTPALAGQPLETETARLPEQGHGNVQLPVEFQTSKAGQEFAVPLALEYGIFNRLELAIEPVLYTSIRPKNGPSASGFGDTEVTLTYLFSAESMAIPALAIAGEVKFPTTKNTIIGTGKTDYRVVLIASKRFGNFDLHGNLGYTFVGKPSGSGLGNIIDYAVALEYEVNPRLTLMTEILGNTSSGGSDNPLSTNQEAAANEVIGLVGFEYRPNASLGFSFGVTYDNNNAILFRPGVTFRF